ncbi:acetyltransferase (GNAT) family protein [Diaminobutyricimonas aerilata]|uniref:Acetyltransferase (GNAT) family protein n=1 Tax=Diaminobutyricimonas aerilata TaxID=1162967 RepID=A0A2M9CIL7_9MICO|nr:GNAT family N-acetyltransferase [Diaminobutyricimonas aerilata]PJJ71737.1 acetyltransferase (GNAT) family protein [Diaminobutyricimonas aerilata]
MSAFTVEELRIPARIEDADAADFIATVDVRNAVEAEVWGSDEGTWTAAELLPGWQSEHEPHRLFGVRVDGRVVARAMFETRLGEAADTAWVVVQVLPEYRRRGIGTALADRVEGVAAESGVRKLIVYTPSADAPGERLVPPTGSGSVPAGNAEVRFLLARGYRLEQVARASRLALPVPAADLEAHLAAATARAGTDYRVERWTGPTPGDRLGDMAHLITRMVTDAPSAGLEEPADPWTAERVHEEELREQASPTTVLTAAVEHVPSGRLAGYTQLYVPREPHRPVTQGDTLVLREHRGHRLGMVLKIANLLHLEQERPGHPSVLTFNAEENRPMLDVNEAVGFVSIGFEGAWRKDL